MAGPSDMYRKEALAARGKALGGRVTLYTPPRWPLITALLAAVLGLLLWGLLGLEIGGVSLWEFLQSQFKART